MKLAYIDTETTGLIPGTNEAYQVAYIVEVDRKVVDEGQVFLRPTKWDAISPEALAINKQTIASLQALPDRRIGYQAFTSMLARYVNKYDRNDKFWWVGQNPRFDMDFVEALFKAEGDAYFGSWFDRRPVDTITLMIAARLRGHIRPANYKLATLCETIGIPLDAHDALNDIRATRLLFHKAMDQFMMPAPAQATA